MNKRYIFALLLVVLFGTSPSFAQQRILYKQVDTTQLFMEIHYPENLDVSKQYPAMVFFFGGGWVNGSIEQFEPHANYFSKRGRPWFFQL